MEGELSFRDTLCVVLLAAGRWTWGGRRALKLLGAVGEVWLLLDGSF